MQRRGNAYHSRMSVPSTHQTPPLCRFNMVEVTDTPGTAPVPESERDPEILYDRHGQPVDGKLTKDRTIVYAGVVVFCILFCSWTAQWVRLSLNQVAGKPLNFCLLQTAFALPYWRGDQYHTGGLFQICGTQDLKYLESNHSLVPDPSPNATHPYRCQSIHAYADDLASWACIKDSTNDVCQGSKLLVGQITMSRWFEALTTTLDMIFGGSHVLSMGNLMHYFRNHHDNFHALSRQTSQKVHEKRASCASWHFLDSLVLRG
ncbi:hypothetical protein BC830DRAFT_268163 [Chytriomyces sp. MP71]|nr:hypothetical protein BC830DRAFT_268163 [Chytriomyces sp. MP71]